MSNKGTNQLGPKGQMVMGGIFIVAAIVVFLLGLGDLRAAAGVKRTTTIKLTTGGGQALPSPSSSIINAT